MFSATPLLWLVALTWQPDARAAEQQVRAATESFRNGRLEEAGRLFERALELAPGHAGAWKGLGMVRAAQENYRLAEGPLRQACELDPGDPDTCYYLARNLYSLNKFDEASATFEKAMRLRPNSWRLHTGLALALEALGRNEEAERHFREAVELYSGGAAADTDPRIDLGAFLYRQGRAEKALPPLAAAVRAQPASSRAHFELGRALLELDRAAEAAVQLETAVTADPKNHSARLLLEKVCFRLGLGPR